MKIYFFNRVQKMSLLTEIIPDTHYVSLSISIVDIRIIFSDNTLNFIPHWLHEPSEDKIIAMTIPQFTVFDFISTIYIADDENFSKTTGSAPISSSYYDFYIYTAEKDDKEVLRRNYNPSDRTIQFWLKEIINKQDNTHILIKLKGTVNLDEFCSCMGTQFTRQTRYFHNNTNLFTFTTLQG